jgi:tetratricopeptide (TPR) repeat protein
LLFDQLVERFPESPFRSDAMARSAAILAGRGHYREALTRYTRLRSTYPETARAVNAEREIDELVLLLDGIGEVEAELLVTIEENERGSLPRGRAIVELGRLAVYDRVSTQTRMSRVLSFLREAGASERTEVAQEALFLIAEHHRLEGSHREAAESYLEAAAVGGAGGELTARAIFNAAQAYSRLGRRSEVEALVEQLEREFPDSPFTSQAQTLLRGGRQ